ncbi:hypothetical protein LLG96_18815 [bacterium]|nr:hypothetical protein [bacterium]
MNIRKIIPIVVTVLFVGSTAGSAERVRNIFSFSYLDYSGIGLSKVFENTALVRVRPSASLLVRAYHDHRSSWNNTIITAGSVLNIGSNHYIELTYGHGRDSADQTSDHFTAELTREKTRYIAGIGFRHSSYPGISFSLLSPSIRFSVTPRLSLWGKYFGSVDSDGNFDQSYWTDGEYGITRRISLRLGITGGNRLYSPEYETLLTKGANMSFFSVLAQVSYIFSDGLTFYYLYENMSRESKYTDLKNILIVDVRF